MFNTRSLRLGSLLLMHFLITLSGCNWPTNGSATVSAISAADPTAALTLGRTPAFGIHVQDEKHGICKIEAALAQEQINLPLTLTEPTGKEEPTDVTYRVGALDLAGAGMQEGDAILSVVVKNCSIFKGETRVQTKVPVDFTPPRVSVTSSQHYINQGGADVATYSLSGDAIWSGVRVGPYEFRGYPKPGTAGAGPTENFAFFVFSYELPSDTPIEIVAYDAAGNVGKASLVPSKFFPKKFRERAIPIDDKFIETKVADIIANTPGLKRSGDNLADYLLVNRELRKTNNKFLIDLSRKSEPAFLWKDAFRPLTNAAIEASFADFRSYTYQQQKVDEQVHLGFDMAVVEHHPIVAAAAGKILFAGYLGIYGNTVVVDHGYGITTLYAHLSSIDVQEGQAVTMDQKLGLSGQTGLAAGDHLHFSMLIQGVQTNPIEFWDQHWIQDHVYLRLGEQAFSTMAANENE